jgi:hypothetical protein
MMIRSDNSQLGRLLRLLHFSWRSLPQAYGRAFVWRLVLRHPLAALGGFLAYARSLAAVEPERRLLLRNSEDEFLEQAAMSGERLLVATGFCQKPLRSATGGFNCPAQRFDHDCQYLRRLQLDSDPTTPEAHACAGCFVAVLGRAALEAGASFAILTSASDIARDILLPALELGRFRYALFAICPFSVEPLALALLVSGMSGYLFAYDSGACADYAQWLRADGGDKPERTALSAQSAQQLLTLLKRIAVLRREQGIPPASRFLHEGHVFRPQ